MTTLIEKLQEIVSGNSSYDSGWGIYADEPIAPSSECRIGETQFDGGGLADGKVLFAHGERIIDEICEYTGQNYPISEMLFSPREVAEAVIESLS